MTSKSAPYEVGYGKPPVDGRFRKGQSGNPAGRRRVKPTKSEIIAKVRDELITVTINGKKQRIEFFEAIVRKVHANAFTKGNSAELERLARFYEKHGVAPEQERLAQLKATADGVMETIMEAFDKMIPDDPPEG